MIKSHGSFFIDFNLIKKKLNRYYQNGISLQTYLSEPTAFRDDVVRVFDNTIYYSSNPESSYHKLASNGKIEFLDMFSNFQKEKTKRSKKRKERISDTPRESKSSLKTEQNIAAGSTNLVPEDEIIRVKKRFRAAKVRRARHLRRLKNVESLLENIEAMNTKRKKLEKDFQVAKESFQQGIKRAKSQVSGIQKLQEEFASFQRDNMKALTKSAQVSAAIEKETKKKIDFIKEIEFFV